MAIFILFCCSFVVLAVIGTFSSVPWKNSRHMIDAEWLEDSDKFELITRWGIVG